MPPTAISYTAGIDAVTRDSNGFRTPLEGETIRIRLLDGTVLAAVTSENQGFVPPQTLASVDSETEVEFYCPGRTGTLRMFTARTPESAFSADVTLILDDAFAGTQTSEFAEVYLRDNTDPNIPLKYLGSQPKDSVRKYLFETSTPKDLDIFAVPRTSKFAYGTVKPEDSAFDSLASVGGLTLDYTRVTGFPTSRLAGRSTAGSGALEPLTLPGIFSIGAGAIGLATQSANNIFAGPTSGIAAPTFRLLAAADIPSLDAAKITTGTIAAARLGSGSGGSSKFLREDSTWQTLSTGLTIGTTAIGSGAANRVLYENGSNVVSESGNLTFNGSTLEVTGTISAKNSSATFQISSDASGYGYLVPSGNKTRLRTYSNPYYLDTYGDGVTGHVHIAHQSGTYIIFENTIGIGNGINFSASGQTINTNDAFFTNLAQAEATYHDVRNGGAIRFTTSTGGYIGTATNQKLAFWGKTPIVQPTTSITGATRVGGAGTTVTTTDTFGGYTIAQLAAIIINTGLGA